MILQTGMRTDIPAFYAEWFTNRIKDGYVLVRNPYNPVQVTKYRLDPTFVDLIGFCSKNPAPMLQYMDIKAFRHVLVCHDHALRHRYRASCSG